MQHLLFPQMVTESEGREDPSKLPSHGIVPPTPLQYTTTQLYDTLEFCRSANSDVMPTELLQKYDPFRAHAAIRHDYLDTLKLFGFSGWQDICDFVCEDVCGELFIRIMKYCNGKGWQAEKDDFIDGLGGGWLDAYLKFLEPYKQRGGDVKYKYRAERPLITLHNRMGFNAAVSRSMLYKDFMIHPPHWRYVAWHGVQFYASAVLAKRLWPRMPQIEYDRLLCLTYVGSMARTGVLVHLPEDNVASAALFPELRVYEGVSKYYDADLDTSN